MAKLLNAQQIKSLVFESLVPGFRSTYRLPKEFRPHLRNALLQLIVHDSQEAEHAYDMIARIMSFLEENGGREAADTIVSVLVDVEVEAVRVAKKMVEHSRNIRTRFDRFQGTETPKSAPVFGAKPARPGALKLSEIRPIPRRL